MAPRQTIHLPAKSISASHAFIYSGSLCEQGARRLYRRRGSLRSAWFLATSVHSLAPHWAPLLLAGDAGRQAQPARKQTLHDVNRVIALAGHMRLHDTSARKDSKCARIPVFSHRIRMHPEIDVTGVISDWLCCARTRSGTPVVVCGWQARREAHRDASLL